MKESDEKESANDMETDVEARLVRELRQLDRELPDEGSPGLSELEGLVRTVQARQRQALLRDLLLFWGVAALVLGAVFCAAAFALVPYLAAQLLVAVGAVVACVLKLASGRKAAAHEQE
ncbi:YxlC family protein [Paenibacillus sp. D51F]